MNSATGRLVSIASAMLNRRLLRAFLAAPSGIAALLAISVILGVAIVAPIFLSGSAEQIDPLQSYKGPTWSHLLGTDSLGRDIMQRLLVATRLSIMLALAASGLGLAIGLLLGSSAALLPARLRPILLRTIDTMLSFPALLTAIFVGAIIGVGATGAVLGVGIAISFALARVTSTLALAVAGRDYISAARVLGVRPTRLLLRYVMPNVAEPLIIATSVAVSTSIVTISALSFLGLGVQSPQYDWGRMMTEGVRVIYLSPAAAVGPAVAIAIAAIAFGFTGEALARAANPRLAGRSRRGGSGRRDMAAPVFAYAGSHEADDMDSLAAGTDTAALTVRDLVVTFPGPDGHVDVVKGVDFSIEPGDMVGIVGESGSGKTMTALAIAQLVAYPGTVTGTITVQGHDVATLRRAQLDKLLASDLAMIFQDPMSSLNPALRIGKQLTEGVRIHRRLSKSAANELAASRLTEVHIPAAARQMRRHPHEFSGGMRQRAMIAMGLMNEPALLIADEPTTALDVSIQAQIMDLLNDVNRLHGTALIMISHNLPLIAQNCRRILVMYAGRIVEDLDVEQLRTNPLHPYSRALLGAAPVSGQERGHRLVDIPGETPDPAEPPPGCPFHPRCPLAIDICRTTRPPLVVRRDERGRRVACHVANDDLRRHGDVD